jgi:hypothetical protein
VYFQLPFQSTCSNHQPPLDLSFHSRPHEVAPYYAFYIPAYVIAILLYFRCSHIEHCDQQRLSGFNNRYRLSSSQPAVYAPVSPALAKVPKCQFNIN